MSSPGGAVARQEAPTGGTRERLIAAAERLFAEQGLSVSNRQIGEAAGQGNNSVVGYHFGTKAELVLAIVRSHAVDIERRRMLMLAEAVASPSARAWLQLVVRPITDHLNVLRSPTWYARFIAQATWDPTLRPLLIEETVANASMQAPFEGFSQLIRDIPPEIFAERADMTRHIAERERALHLGLPTPRATWSDAAEGILDALVALWGARKRCRSSRYRRRRAFQPRRSTPDRTQCRSEQLRPPTPDPAGE